MLFSRFTPGAAAVMVSKAVSAALSDSWNCTACKPNTNHQWTPMWLQVVLCAALLLTVTAADPAPAGRYRYGHDDEYHHYHEPHPRYGGGPYYKHGDDHMHWVNPAPVPPTPPFAPEWVSAYAGGWGLADDQAPCRFSYIDNGKTNVLGGSGKDGACTAEFNSELVNRTTGVQYVKTSSNYIWVPSASDTSPTNLVFIGIEENSNSRSYVCRANNFNGLVAGKAVVGAGDNPSGATCYTADGGRFYGAGSFEWLTWA